MFCYPTSTRQQLTDSSAPLRLAGLNPQHRYRSRELNLYPGTKSTVATDQLYSGDFLMRVGFNPDVTLSRSSVVLEVATDSYYTIKNSICWQ